MPLQFHFEIKNFRDFKKKFDQFPFADCLNILLTFEKSFAICSHEGWDTRQGHQMCGRTNIFWNFQLHWKTIQAHSPQPHVWPWKFGTKSHRLLLWRSSFITRCDLPNIPWSVKKNGSRQLTDRHFASPTVQRGNWFHFYTIFILTWCWAIFFQWGLHLFFFSLSPYPWKKNVLDRIFKRNKKVSFGSVFSFPSFSFPKPLICG